MHYLLFQKLQEKFLRSISKEIVRTVLLGDIYNHEHFSDGHETPFRYAENHG